MTVTIVPAIPISKARASSAVPWNASGERGPTLTTDSRDPTARAAANKCVVPKLLMPSLPVMNHFSRDENSRQGLEDEDSGAQDSVGPASVCPAKASDAFDRGNSTI